MPPAAKPPARRLKLAIRGAVQGVGFRPFIYRLAADLHLTGWVNNSAQGVFVEVEGPTAELERFLMRVEAEKPPRSFIQSFEASWLDPVGFAGFEIRSSDAGGERSALVLPDVATCPDCLREMLDPANRRYRYPFTNCTHCGPRFSIIEALPYDRVNTSMKAFTMCPQCQAEYDDPQNRRFHAQPNACPVCGPHLELWDRTGAVLAGGGLREKLGDVTPTEIRTSSPEPCPLTPSLSPGGREGARRAGEGDSGKLMADEQIQMGQGSAWQGSDGALLAAAQAIRSGQIVAIKGLGGFHLMVDAGNEGAVHRLRERKHREEKPLALMFPTLTSVKQACEVSPLEERLLCSPEAPIVLLHRIAGHQSPIANDVAPGNPHLGVMLPYTPLHHLLMAELGFPVVATSGNLSDEPICIDEHEARERLGGIADVFLVHNRPIVRYVDDSVVRVMLGRELVLRRARGYAPLPVTLNLQLSTLNSQPVLAVGAHLKNTVALSVGPQVFVSQHIGDLETEPAFEAFRRVIGDFQQLYNTQPQVVAHDLHPDYLSTKFASQIAEDRSDFALAQRSLEPVRPPLTPSLSPSGGEGARRAGEGARSEETPSPLQPAEDTGKSSRLDGAQSGRPRTVGVQHHYAHVLSCMAENELEPPVLGVSWDGTGYGLDGTVWGGEFLLVSQTSFERVTHLRPFRLPGGEAAVKEPRRVALGLLYELLGVAAFDRHELPPIAAFSPAELATLGTMLKRGINAPWTSSAGRLFDAIASLIGLRQTCRFEGQAAMELEFALTDSETAETYPLSLTTREAGKAESVFHEPHPLTPSLSPSGGEGVRRTGEGAGRFTVGEQVQKEQRGSPGPVSALVLDWSPMVKAILADLERAVPIGKISAKFHNGLVEAIISVARRIGEQRVALTGGCFQNRYLTERAVQRLQEEGFHPYWHQRIPPNDGGISLGQVVAAWRESR